LAAGFKFLLSCAGDLLLFNALSFLGFLASDVFRSGLGGFRLGSGRRLCGRVGFWSRSFLLLLLFGVFALNFRKLFSNAGRIVAAGNFFRRPKFRINGLLGRIPLERSKETHKERAVHGNRKECGGKHVPAIRLMLSIKTADGWLDAHRKDPSMGISGRP